MGIKILKRFLKSEKGASMVEYGVALLVVTAIGVTLMNTLGEEVEANVVDACNAVGGTGTCTDD